MTRHLITSALPYINGVKHLGNLVGSMLPADVYARHRRLAGDEVLFVCATDEHGTPAEIAAAEAGQPVAEYCDAQHEVQRELGERWGLSWDWFGRTSRPQNHEITQHLARALAANGLIEERVTRQVYSPADGRFLPDRYVVGTCPNCGFERARGDQCDQCTKQLDPTDLIDPRSSISGSADLEVRETRHLFLLQSKLADRIRAWVDTQEHWPVVTSSIAYKWLDEGLEDRGITRDLSWGIPVPTDTFPGFEGKVFYVWFDAPIGYIAATKEWSDADPSRSSWRTWWRTDEGADDVTYTQFMGKDNVPFHTLSFPATLLGSGEPWKLVDTLKGFNYLNYQGGKFSTSEGRGVFMDDALDVAPADVWRWYLVSNAPESSDTSFTWDLFAESTNKELVGALGNFVNRCAVQVERHFAGRVPEGGVADEVEAALLRRVEERIAEYRDALDALELRKAAHALRALWAEGNVYLEEREPWRAVKVDRDLAAVTLRHALGLVRLYGHLGAAILPTTAASLAATLPEAPALVGLDAGALAASVAELAGGTPFVAPGLLFRKLEPDDLAAWQQRFG